MPSGDFTKGIGAAQVKTTILRVPTTLGAGGTVTVLHTLALPFGYTWSKVSGDANIAVSSGGDLTIVASIGDGVTQNAIVKAANGTSEVRYTVSLVGYTPASGGGGGSPGSLTIAGVSRPTITLTLFWNAFGDSTTAGVGSGSPWPTLFRTLTTSTVTRAFHGGGTSDNGASIVDIGNGGVGGEDSGQIAARVSTQNGSFGSELARNYFTSFGLNDYNTLAPNYTNAWPPQVRTNYEAIRALVKAADASKEVYHFIAVQELDKGSGGQRYGGDYLFHRHDMAANHPGRSFDLLRYFQMVRRLELQNGGLWGTGTADEDAIKRGLIPYLYCGGTNTAAFTATSTAMIPVAGVPSDLTQPDGTLAYNTLTNLAYRKMGAPGAGSYTPVDVKHRSAQGNTVWSQYAADIAMAIEGTGPPVAAPLRAYIPANIASGAAVATPQFLGVPTGFALRNYDDTPAVGFDIDQTTGAITRASTGIIAEGRIELVGVIGNGNGSLTFPVDISVARPTTQQVPAMKTVGAPGLNLGSRDNNGFPNTTALSGAFWINLTNAASQPYVLLTTRTGASPVTAIQIQINSSRLAIIRAWDTANTQVSNTTCLAAIPASTDTWVYWAIDPVNNLRNVFIHETSSTFTGTLTNTGNNIPVADAWLSMFGNGPSVQYGAPTGSIQGGIGFQCLIPGYVDWAASSGANRRLLTNTSGIPVARTPYAPIGGLTPYFEWWGDLGSADWGTPDGSIGSNVLSLPQRALPLGILS